MRVMSRTLVLFLTLAAACAAAPDEPMAIEASTETVSTEITFEAAHGVMVHADVIPAVSPQKAPTVILLHQAGSNGRGEYGPITGELSKSGINIVLVDLRSGDTRFGETNRTVDNNNGREYSYCEAYPDIEAAVGAARAQGWNGLLYVWGSSYSAALAIKYAALHPDEVTGYLAFSPASGPPMEGCQPNQYAEMAGNGLVLRPEREMSYPGVQDQFDLFAQHGARTIIVPNGVHGSSMLVDARTKHDMSALRAQVIDFIHSTAQGGE